MQGVTALNMACFLVLSQIQLNNSWNFISGHQRVNSRAIRVMNTMGGGNREGADPAHVSQQYGRKFLHHLSVTFTC